MLPIPSKITIFLSCLSLILSLILPLLVVFMFFFAVAFLCEYKSTVVDEVNVVFRCPKIWNKNNRSFGTGMFGFTWANKWCDVVRVFNEEHVQCLIRVSYDVCLHYLVPGSILRIFLTPQHSPLPFPPLHSPRLPLEVGPLNPARGSLKIDPA